MSEDAASTLASQRAEKWLIVPNWARFQHYKDRDPTWIKDYVSQLHDDAWSHLTYAERGLLQSLRLCFAASDGRVTYSDAIATSMSRSNAQTGRVHGLATSLIEAGLIDLRASKPPSLSLALARSREKSSAEKSDRASAREDQEHDDEHVATNTNGALEQTGVTVDQEMLRLARGWINEHDPNTPTDPRDVDEITTGLGEIDASDDNPFL